MRNIFDQYDQPENRLTHALMASLSQDRSLLCSFLHWICGFKIKKSRNLYIVEQGIAGELEVTEEDVEHIGLPDGWIHDEDDWCLLIESKISSKLTKNQLRRHYKTAKRCGFMDITILTIEANPTIVPSETWLLQKTWSELYVWLKNQSYRSQWAALATDYFEVAERKLISSGYLKEGNLTVFTGIPFNKDHPYNYSEAKRLLKLILEEIRKDKTFCRRARIDPESEGRGSITGKGGKAVWDFLRLEGSDKSENFTAYPHFTLGFNYDRIHTSITIPHKILTRYRRNLTELGIEEFEALISQLVTNMRSMTKRDIAFTPWCTAVQRRYPSQRAAPIHDAVLEFDLRTALNKNDTKVKIQKQWLTAAYDALSYKNSNYQLQIGSHISYERSKLAGSKEIVRLIKGTWEACRPLLDVITQ